MPLVFLLLLHIFLRLVFAQDITARIAQEQEYARVIETANAPIFGVDLMGKVTLWNKCSADVTSFYSAEVMGRQLVQQFICEDFRVLAQEVIDKALRGEETANFEFSIITKTQTKVHILLNATPQRNKFGHVIGMVSIGQDITARIVHAEEYSKLIDTANALIFCVDISGKVTVWNKCAANISGYTSEDTMGHNFVQEFITEAFRASVQGVLDKALRGPVDSNFDFPLVTKDGRRIEISLNATSRRDENGRIVGVVGIGQDITDARARHEAEMRQREAEAAQSAQSTILAHVYHEIRNVVSTVLALAERASEAVDLALEDASGELLKKLPDTVRHLTEHQSLVWAHAVNTLNDMLDVARMENGTYMPSSMLIDLGALCSKAAKLQGPRLKSGVQLHLDCPSPGALIVLSDPSLLLQYLTNLLSNAAKFTESGHVMITCRSSPHATQKGWVNVILGVADTGPGIHPSDQERVLQAFTTGNVVPTEDVGVSVRSTGIGLRLSNLIAGILGGVDPAGGSNCEKDVRGVNADRMKSEKLDVKKSIHITSPLPSRLSAKMTGGGGPGTYLAITASMEIASKESIRKETIAANVNGPSLDDHSFTLEPSGNLRVLVVDDQRTMRQMVCTLFQHVCMEHPDMRVEITTALSGDEAVRVSRQKHFHVITMDQTLSAGYCKTVQAMQGSLRAERRAQGGASDDTPGSFDDIAMLNVDADRMQTSKRRTEFFKDELMHHMVLFQPSYSCA
jgi:PAS domain S-box-containing protein